MANVFAVKSGNWSDVTVWNTGSLPTSADDVFSNNFTVTIDTSPTILSLRNSSATGIAAGGTFVPISGITLTLTGSGVLFGTTTTSAISSTLIPGQLFTINGNIAGGGGGAGGRGISNSSGGTININGNVQGGTSNQGGGQCPGIVNTSGTINVVGNITGGGTGASPAISNAGTLSITGNVTGNGIQVDTLSLTGSSITNITGNVTGALLNAINLSGGTCNITGVCTSTGGSSAIVNTSASGIINITGTCTGGSSTGAAFVNNSTGTITHIGTAQASATAPAIGTGAVGQNTRLTGPLLCSTDAMAGASASGVNPCIALRWFPRDTALGTFTYRMKAESLSGSSRPDREMYLPQYFESTYPVISNVRSGTIYGPGGMYVGTMSVPEPESVLAGVPIDSELGTAVLELDAEAFWNVPETTEFAPGSMGDRIKNLSTVASVGEQIVAINQN